MKEGVTSAARAPCRRRQPLCTSDNAPPRPLAANDDAPPAAPPPPRPTRARAQSAFFDFPSLLTVLLLFICTSAFLRAATYNAQSKSSWLDTYKHG